MGNMKLTLITKFYLEASQINVGFIKKYGHIFFMEPILNFMFLVGFISMFNLISRRSLCISIVPKFKWDLFYCFIQSMDMEFIIDI